MKYRSRMDIVTTVLDAARTGISRTKIMYSAYLSYAQTIEYLEFLHGNGLLKYEQGSKTYRTTEKGLKFLHASSKVNDMMGMSNSK